MSKKSDEPGPMTARTFDGWTAEPMLGEGGNESVYAAHRGGIDAAIKFLHRRFFADSRGERFRQEIEAMQLYQDVPGILAVLDHHIPATWTEVEPPWFVMPKAESYCDRKDDIVTLAQ